MTDTFQKTLKQILTDHPPKSLLCVGQGVVAMIPDYLTRHPDCKMMHIDLAKNDFHNIKQSLSVSGIFDFGIVADCIEHIDKANAEHLLARLRDIHTKRLLVVVPLGKHWANHSSHWEESELLALGFILKAKITGGERPVHVYAFDIDSYKTTPEWLNNKYWANPELWDKYWW
jgi:hypothetical protein